MVENLPAVRRGDSFDVSEPQVGQTQQIQVPITVTRSGNQQDILINALSNPSDFINGLGLTDAQAKNLIALMTGGGAALSVKYLGDAFGEEIAGALGALLGAYGAKKVVKRGRAKKTGIEELFNGL